MMRFRLKFSPADYVYNATNFPSNSVLSHSSFIQIEKSAGEFYKEPTQGGVDRITDSTADWFFKMNTEFKSQKSAVEVLPSIDKFAVKSRNIVCLLILLVMLALTVPATNAQQTFTGSDDVEVTIDDLSRVVSIGSAVTETIFALDATENLVAVDESSTYPEETAEYTKVSFTRNLSAEGLLSVSPSVILASTAAGPEPVIQQIRSAGVPFLKLPADETVDGAFERIRQLGQIFDKEAAADQIIQNIQSDLDVAAAAREGLSEKPTVLFIYARGANMLMVAGNGTSAKTMIELAGGENAFNSFEGFKPLTAEAVVEANPDVILMMNSGIQSVGGKEGVLQAPGISLTDAAKNDRIYSMDGIYLLNFGPRVGQAALDLMAKFHPGIELTENF